MNSGWVETPKLRKRIVFQDEKKRSSSVPSTPLSSSKDNNHFDVLSPPPSPTLSKRKKKKKRGMSRSSSTTSSIRSPLSNEITNWDQSVPNSESSGLHILRNDNEQQQDQLQQPEERLEPEEPQSTPIDEQSSLLQQQPDETLQQISFLDYLKDELTVADFDSAQELKRERVTNFLGVPAAIEKVN